MTCCLSDEEEILAVESLLAQGAQIESAEHCQTSLLSFHEKTLFLCGDLQLSKHARKDRVYQTFMIAKFSQPPNTD